MASRNQKIKPDYSISEARWLVATTLEQREKCSLDYMADLLDDKFNLPFSKLEAAKNVVRNMRSNGFGGALIKSVSLYCVGSTRRGVYALNGRGLKWLETEYEARKENTYNKPIAKTKSPAKKASIQKLNKPSPLWKIPKQSDSKQKVTAETHPHLFRVTA